MERRRACVGAGRAAPVFVLLALLESSTPLFAQETGVLPPAWSVPVDSTVDVQSLAAPSAPSRSQRTPLRVKPFRSRDPEALSRWKELLRETPGALRAAPDMSEDSGAPPSLLAPSVALQFDGLANSDNVSLRGFQTLPPDDTLAVGPSHVFEMVNSVGRVTDRSGTALSTFSLAAFFGVDAGFDEADPRVLYDAASGRWFAVYAQFSDTKSSSSAILAVSRTGDPRGTFCRLRLGHPTSETFFQDYPMLGVSDDKVVVSYNGFSFSTDAFIGSGYYVVNKADLTACARTVRVTRAAPSLARDTPHPAQALGSASTAYMAMHGSPGGALTIFSISGVPGVAPVTATQTLLAIRTWASPPNARQAGSSVLLDTGDDRVLSVAWQGDSLWLAGGEACTPAGDVQARSCLRAIEVRTDGPSVRQDMTFGAAGQYYYYPAVRPDRAGNLHVVFTGSSALTFAGVRVTGRQSTDPLNALEASAQIRVGGGAQKHSSGRMGDYSGAAVDPSEPFSVWVVGEYIQSTGTENWKTVIAQLRRAGADVSLNGSEFGPGQTLRIGVAVQNPSGNPTRELYVGAVLPDGQAVFLFFAAAAPPGFSLTDPAYIEFTMPPSGIVPGTYRFFAALLKQGALSDGTLGPGELVAFDVESFTLSE